MRVTISRKLHDQLLAEAAAADGREICGLLLGRGTTVSEARPAANMAGHPETRFEIDPAVLIAAHRAARDGALPVLGHYHSHPAGAPVPSAEDAAQAAGDGAIWLIIGQGGMAAWQAVRGGPHRNAFAPLALDIAETVPACQPEPVSPEGRAKGPSGQGDK